MRSLINYLKNKIPGLCLFCATYHKGEFALCEVCKQLLRPLASACAICKFPLPDNKFHLCGSCTLKKPHFDRVFTAYSFEEPMRLLIHHFKYHEALYLTKFLTQLIMDGLKEERYQADCIIPVPLHKERLKLRGFNQAAELAKQLSSVLRIKYEARLCQKIVNTSTQAMLNRSERQANLKGAFQIKPSNYQKIALVDDLLTTGATANELAFLLKKSGVKTVDILCCARVF